VIHLKIKYVVDIIQSRRFFMLHPVVTSIWPRSSISGLNTKRLTSTLNDIIYYFFILLITIQNFHLIALIFIFCLNFLLYSYIPQCFFLAESSCLPFNLLNVNYFLFTINPVSCFRLLGNCCNKSYANYCIPQINKTNCTSTYFFISFVIRRLRDINM
jgi:hypothetical protein